jgi:anti-sigma factor RsiW
MKCDRALPCIEAFADGELSVWRRMAIRRHLATCAACAARFLDARSLQARIRAEAPRFAAPDSLRAKVMAMPGGSPAPAAARYPPVQRWQWVAVGAVLGCAITLVAWFAGNAALDRRENADIASAAVAAHVRATLAKELIQVASSDQHTVKPWLSSRLDYSPPVRDFAAEGFPLVGARIEDLGGHPVATLVYRYREHNVDVFVRPDWLRTRALAPATLRGFHVLRADGQGMDWLVVTDAGVEFIAPLLRRLAEGDSLK